MDTENQKSGSKRFHKWFKKKHRGGHWLGPNEASDVDEVQNDKWLHENDARSMEVHPCILNNEIRIFVGTWNVGGKSPEGTLAVDLSEWLDIKDTADLYVLGFQEIVPLKTRNVIGAEDQTAARNWNELIEKTLNNMCPLTPLMDTVSSKRTHIYGEGLNSEWRNIFGQSPIPKRSVRTISHQEKSKWGTRYQLLASKKMVGVFISIWVKKELLYKYCISNVKVCSVACGLMGYLGNKGAVSVRMSIEGTTFCFIAAHLASGEKKGDEGRRNHQVMEIFKRTTFSRSSDKDDHNSHPLTILGHDQIFWFGDLNYRLYLEDKSARELIEKKDWKALQEFDQLRKGQQDGGVFEGWREGTIEFAPTYKYSTSNSNFYSGGFPGKSGEKQRTPAWCDRILWYGKGVKELSYFRSESKFSDHRPVSAIFSTQIEILPTNPRVVPLRKLIPTKKSPNRNKGW